MHQQALPDSLTYEDGGIRPAVLDSARASTVSINSFHGGQAERYEDFTGWPSALVSHSCRMIFERRFPVEEDLDAVKELRETIEDSCRS